jgi:peptide/nickel transport system substrate-binding protein
VRSKSFVLSRVVVVLVVAGMALAGTAVAASAQSAKSKTGGTLQFLLNTEPPGMDPIQMREIPNISPAFPAQAVFDELVYTDPVTLKVKPKIATSLTTADKGLTWVLKIRPDVKFSDGTPYDAAAVQYNWQRIADPANRVPFAQYAQEVGTYEMPDPLTLKLTLKAADPYFDQWVARALSTIGSPTALKANATAFSSKPVGAGPYLLKDWVRLSSMTFVRNPNYWQKGKPYIDEIDTKFVSDDAARANTLTSGAASVALEGAAANLRQYRASGKYDVQNTPTNGGGYGFIMNLSKPPFNDLRVRQAIALTLNSAEIVQRSDNGDKSAVMKTIDEKFSPYYNPKLTLPKQDPAAAQKLIDAYVADNGGKPVEFSYIALNVPNHIRIATAIQAVLSSKLKNVNMSIEILEPTVGVPRYSSGNYQATLNSARWTSPPIDDPPVFQTGSGLNYTKYSNATVDAALKEMTLTTDPKVVQQAHDTVVAQVLKDVPIVWLMRFQTYMAVEKAAVKDWKMIYELRPMIENVYLSKKS